MFFRRSHPSCNRIFSFTALIASLALFTVSCTGVGDRPNETTTARDATDEITESSGEGSPETVEVVGISSGDLGRGQPSPRVVVSDSFEAPGEGRAGQRTSPETPGSEVTYLYVYRGERRTGGYSVEVSSARMEGDTVVVTLKLGDPPQGAIVTQAITYPYAIAALEGVGADEEFSFEDESGEPLDWPVERRISG